MFEYKAHAATSRSSLGYCENEAIQNCFFLIDNDNNPAASDLTSSRAFTQLNRYCIENYFLDLRILNAISISQAVDIASEIKSSILENKGASFKVFHRLIESNIEIDDSLMSTLDGSQVLRKLAGKLGFKNHYDLMTKYIEKAHEDDRVDELFAEVCTFF